MAHYTIVSPLMTEYSQDEPPEDFFNWITLEAESKSDAEALALTTKEFDEWRKFARDDRISPFKGLEVYDNTCPHGGCNCENCLDDDGMTKCSQCLPQWEKWLEEN